jgi:hypothetical protein
MSTNSESINKKQISKDKINYTSKEYFQISMILIAKNVKAQLTIIGLYIFLSSIFLVYNNQGLSISNVLTSLFWAFIVTIISMTIGYNKGKKRAKGFYFYILDNNLYFEGIETEIKSTVSIESIKNKGSIRKNKEFIEIKLLKENFNSTFLPINQLSSSNLSQLLLEIK